ncbi:hypothetical protein GGI12_002307 [Dipsacomyces acuminosporus]|nr:hypothetical protein GGI12_002307 [Dipsacomyces acuminosporus]
MFVRINSGKSDVEEGLERWRGDVLNVFKGDLKEITRAANLFVKLSPNKALAYALYKVAAEEGYQNAAYHYAVILGTGSMHQKNGRAVGTKIIKDLAAFGHPPSQMLLAETILLKSSPEETANAIEMMERAAGNGVPGAAFKLGSLYREGKVVARDFSKALFWYEKASGLGAPEGCFMIGNMHSTGQGTPDGKPDYAQALEHFERAAMGGNVEAQYNVGLYYLEGKGTEKNPGLAVEYWTMAAAERFPVAMLNLGKLFAEGKNVPKDPKRARQLLETAIECSGSDGFIESEAKSLLSKLEPYQRQQQSKDTQQRFYGSSKPDTTSNLDDVLKYLTVEQMMSDIYRFVNAVDIPELHKQKRNVSWVLVGGSFAGSLMAWTKYKYRDLDVAVIASSAPMQIKDGYWEFDKVVMQRLPCAASVSHAVQEVDEVLRSQNITQIGSLKRDFGLGSIRSTEDFASALTVQISSMMQKPAATEDIQDQIHDFCAHFTQQQQPNGHFSLEQLQSATRQFIQTQGALSPDSCPKGDDLVWFWQQCTELGLWQTAPPASSHWSQHRLRSEHLSVGYFQSECRRCIPESTSNSIAESKREFRSFAAHALDSYLAENESGSTLFTVGELDPWRYLAVPVDNRSNSSSNNILVIRGASHAEDLIGSRGGIQNMEIEHAHSQMISMVERKHGQDDAAAAASVTVDYDVKGYN